MRKRLLAGLTAVFCFLQIAVVPVEAKTIETREEFFWHLNEVMTDIETYHLTPIELQQMYEGALEGVLQSTGKYGHYYNESEYDDSIFSDSKPVGIGIVYSEKGNSLIVTYVQKDSAANRAGIQIGDVIKTINGEPALSYLETNKTLQSGQQLSMEVQKKNTTRIQKAVVTISEYSLDSVRIWGLDEIYLANELPSNHKQYRFLSISSFKHGTGDEVAAAIEQMKNDGVKRVVLDLRGNPGGLLNEMLDVARLFVPEGVVTTHRVSDGSKGTYYSSLKEKPFEKLIVMVNEDSASAAEILTAALQDTGHTVVGQKSYGKGIGQHLFENSNKDKYQFTTGEYLRRNGGKINGVGVRPDVVVDYIDVKSDDITDEEWHEVLTGMGFGAPTMAESLVKFHTELELGEIDTLTNATKVLIAHYLNYPIKEFAELDKALEILIN